MKEKEYTYVGKKATIVYTIGYGINIDYESGLQMLNPDITFVHVRYDDYQGDINSLGVDKKGNFYFKGDSYGSCSGCDWVQGISTEEEAIEFLKSREVLVELGSDKEKVKSYLKAQFRVDEHSYYIEENKKILSTFLAFLKDN